GPVWNECFVSLSGSSPRSPPSKSSSHQQSGQSSTEARNALNWSDGDVNRSNIADGARVAVISLIGKTICTNETRVWRVTERAGIGYSQKVGRGELFERRRAG